MDLGDIEEEDSASHRDEASEAHFELESHDHSILGINEPLLAFVEALKILDIATIDQDQYEQHIEISFKVPKYSKLDLNG